MKTLARLKFARILSSALVAFVAFASAATTMASDLRDRVVYYVMIDRFYDGSSANNYADNGAVDPDAAQYWPNEDGFGRPGDNIGNLSYPYSESGEPNDQGLWKKFWGGDIQGLTEKVPYLASVGVGTIYITCPVKQTETMAYYAPDPNNPRVNPYTAYHGYWMKDFYRIDEHWAGPTRWKDSDPGEAGGDEGWAIFDAFVAEAKKYDIEIMVDVPLNHSNPANLGYPFTDKDASGNTHNYPAGHAGWGEGGAVYQDKSFVGAFGGYYDFSGGDGAYSDSSWFYHHNGSGNNAVNETAFPGFGWAGLADFNTTLQNGGFDNVWSDPEEAADNLTTYNYLLEGLKRFVDHGVYNFRIDATKHTHMPFLRKITGDLSVYAAEEHNASIYYVGEWFDSAFPPNDGQNGGYGGSFQYENGGQLQHYANFSDYYYGDPTANFDFQFMYQVRGALAYNGSFDGLKDYMAGREGFFNGHIAGNNDWQMNLINNQDQNRFMVDAIKGGNLSKEDAQKHTNISLALLLTARGIPMMMYGDEIHLYTEKAQGGHGNNVPQDHDPYSRLMMADNFDSLWQTNPTTYGSIHSASWKLANLRRNNKALSEGEYRERWVNDDIYIFERQFNDQVVLVAVNKGNSDFTYNGQSGLFTALPAGSYSDYLNGDLHTAQPTTMNVSGTGSATGFTLKSKQVLVFTNSSGAILEPSIIAESSVSNAGGNFEYDVRVLGAYQADNFILEGATSVNGTYETIGSSNSTTFTASSSTLYSHIRVRSSEASTGASSVSAVTTL